MKSTFKGFNSKLFLGQSPIDSEEPSTCCSNTSFERNNLPEVQSLLEEVANKVKKNIGFNLLKANDLKIPKK